MSDKEQFGPFMLTAEEHDVVLRSLQEYDIALNKGLDKFDLTDEEIKVEIKVARSALDIMFPESDDEGVDPCACPGCGCLPGEGRTRGCMDKMGCGYQTSIIYPQCSECNESLSLSDIEDYRTAANGADDRGFPEVCQICAFDYIFKGPIRWC